MAGCIVKRCGCKGNPPNCSDYQDQKYGEGMRLMTLDQKKVEAVCTVCGKTHKA